MPIKPNALLKPKTILIKSEIALKSKLLINVHPGTLRRMCQNKGLGSCTLLENTAQRKPVLWYILCSGIR